MVPGQVFKIIIMSLLSSRDNIKTVQNNWHKIKWLKSLEINVIFKNDMGCITGHSLWAGVIKVSMKKGWD